MKKSFIFALLLWTFAVAHPLTEPRSVRVGVFQAAPLVLIKDGKPDGLFIDLIEYFGKAFDWKIEYVPGIWNDLLNRLEKGEIDLLPAVGLTEQRLEKYDFSRNPVFIDSGVLFANKRLVLHTVFDLKGKRVAGVRGSIFTTRFIEYMKSFDIECRMILVEDNRQVMEAITRGEADAGVCIYSLGSVLAREFSIPITPISFSPIALEFAVPKGRNGDLLAGIDDQMATMIGDPQSYYSRAFETWTTPADTNVLPIWLLWGCIGAVGIACLVGIWSLSLRRQVTAKTGDLRDEIAERKRVEAEVRQLNADLEIRVAERTREIQAAIGTLESFTYSIAHDLRAPVRVMIGYSQILKEACSGHFDPDNKHLLDRILFNAEKMDSLISGLLSLSHVMNGEMTFKQTDMTSLARLAYQEMASPQVQEAFSFSLSALPPCRGDPLLLQQVWSNLIGNAIKYTQQNAERRIDIDGHIENGMNIYSVKDTGVGFDEQYSGKLFIAFSRLHSEREFEGNGIGLSIVARIVSRHGGTAWAHGEPGKGATFHFSIPVRD